MKKAKKVLPYFCILFFILYFSYLAVRYHIHFAQKKAAAIYVLFLIFAVSSIIFSYLKNHAWLKRSFIGIILLSILANIFVFQELTVQRGLYRINDTVYSNSLNPAEIMNESHQSDPNDKFFLFFDAVNPLQEKNVVSTKSLSQDFLAYKSMLSAKSYKTMPLQELTLEESKKLDLEKADEIYFRDKMGNEFYAKFIINTSGDYALLPYKNILYAFPLALLTPKNSSTENEASFSSTLNNLESIRFTIRSDFDNMNVTLKHLLVSLFFALIGFFLLLPLKNNLGYTRFFALLWPMGLSVYLLSFSLVFLLGIPINLYSLMLSIIIVLLISMFLLKKFRPIATERAKWTLSCSAVLALNLLLIIVFSVRPLFIIVTDTIGQLFQTTSMLHGNQSPLFSTILSYSLIHVPVFSFAKLIGLNYYFALPNLLFTSGILCIFVFINYSWKQNLKQKLFANLLSFVYVVSLPMMLLGFALLLNNVPLGILVAILFVLFQHLYLHDNYPRTAFLALCAPLIFLSMLARIENMLFYTLALLFLPILQLDRKKERNIAHLYIVVATLSFITYSIQTNFDNTSIFWTFQRGLMIEVLSILVYFIILLKESLCKIKIFEFAYKNLHYIINIFTLLICIALSILKPERSSLNWLVYQTNFLFIGQYGLHWMTFALIPLFYPYVTNKKQAQFVFLYSIEFFFAMFLIMIFRIYPLRIGDGDSSNRMAMHIFTLFIPILIDILFSKKEPDQIGNQS